MSESTEYSDPVMPTIIKQFEYKPKWTMILVAGAFFLACTVVFAYLATVNQGGITLNGFIRLSPAGARLFFGLAAGTMCLFVIAAVILAVSRAGTSFSIAIKEDGLLLPSGQSRPKQDHVLFRDITEIKQAEFHGSAFLYIYANGLRYTVLRDMLPNREAFEELVAVLQRHLADRD